MNKQNEAMRIFMIENHITQKDLARQLGYHEKSIARLLGHEIRTEKKSSQVWSALFRLAVKEVR